MKSSINFSQFVDGFKAIRPDNFTYEGLETLFVYLSQYEIETGEELDFDVIALCCDYSEDTPLSIAENYGIEIDINETDDEIMQQVKDFLEVETIMLGSTDAGTIVYQQF